MRRAESGLTLLEILGAVALLGILYTVLAGKAIVGVRAEGESRRRLEASLLADDRLTEIELALAAGTGPTLGRTEEEVDGFTVVTEVRPFEPPPPAQPAGGDAPSLAARRARAAAGATASGDAAPSLFAASRAPGADPPLRTIELAVAWTEGIYEREVRRTTFFLDATAVEALFAEVAAPQGLGGGRPPSEAAAGAREGRGGDTAVQRAAGGRSGASAGSRTAAGSPRQGRSGRGNRASRGPLAPFGPVDVPLPGAEGRDR
jgi:hypothetical protein